jgi:hypothetical protein
MVDFGSVLFLLEIVPYFVGTIILAIATLISFRLSRQKQSHGLFLITLGFLTNLIINGSWELFYWFVLGGTNQALILYRQGLTASQIAATIVLTGSVGEAVTTAGYVLMLSLTIYGAVQIIREGAQRRAPSQALP